MSSTTTMTETTENIEDLPDRVSDLYLGKTIFITGGTGFLGKVLVEKLLRSCSGLKKIYLLVRTKKGRHPRERLRDLFSSPVSKKSAFWLTVVKFAYFLMSLDVCISKRANA